MNEKVQQFAVEYTSAMSEAEGLCYATRAIELQLQAIERLQSLKKSVMRIKEEAASSKAEDLANRLLSCECRLEALIHELRMWIALKQDEPDLAWENLVTAQSSATDAMRAHESADDLQGYVRRLLAIEAVVFPPQRFVSIGIKAQSCTCSICGEEYGECMHVKGRPYMGKLCARIIGESYIEHTALVDEPANKDCRFVNFTDQSGVSRDWLTWRVVEEGKDRKPGNAEAICWK